MTQSCVLSIIPSKVPYRPEHAYIESYCHTVRFLLILYMLNRKIAVELKATVDDGEI